MPEKAKTKEVAPIFTKIALFAAKISPINKKDIERAIARIKDEFDGFVRTGNRTDYRRVDDNHPEAEAFSSAAIEVMSNGDRAFVHSTMVGRRIEDMIHVVLWEISEVIFPPQERADVNTSGPNAGQKKLNHMKRERNAWIAGLGFTKAKVGKGQRALFGDQWAPLKEELEKLIPERFVGTDKPSTQKLMVPLIAPPRLKSCTATINLYREVAPEAKLAISTELLVAWLQDGFRPQVDKTGEFKSELIRFYAKRIIESGLYKFEEPKAEQATDETTEATEEEVA
jgi:hypothetical protein